MRPKGAVKLHLGGSDEDLSIFGRAEVVEDAHESGGLCARLLSLRHVQVHLVAVEVGVVRIAHALVESQRPAHTFQPTQYQLVWQQDAADR